MSFHVYFYIREITVNSIYETRKNYSCHSLGIPYVNPRCCSPSIVFVYFSLLGGFPSPVLSVKSTRFCSTQSIRAETVNEYTSSLLTSCSAFFQSVGSVLASYTVGRDTAEKQSFISLSAGAMGSLDSQRQLTFCSKTDMNSSKEQYKPYSKTLFGMPRNRGYTAEVLAFFIGAGLLLVGIKLLL